MRTIDAAVLHGPRDLRIEEVSLDLPAAGEVRVDVRAAGVCHTDYHRYVGEMADAYPVVLGHEGAGVVEAVGDGVTGLSPGDRVVLTVTTCCGSCGPCCRGEPFLCANDDPVHRGRLLDGTRRLSLDGDPVDHFFAQSSFAQQAVVPATTAVPVPPSVPFEVAALLGCGASTGVGSVLSTADVEPGSSVAVFGCGGVGTSAVLGAAVVHADPCLAVDVVAERRETATALGATHAVDPERTDPVDRVRRLTGEGVDYAFECTGKPSVQTTALAATRPGGTTVMVGGGGGSDGPRLDARRDLVPGGKTVVGSVVGSLRPSADVPRYAQLYEQGVLDLDALVTRRYDLDDLSRAFADLKTGVGVRGVVTFDEGARAGQRLV
jgi:S-(hydroxymethyl)glutathione dehydrogenase/alcohol dehydrogenase